MSELDFSAMRAAMVSNQLRTNNVSEPRMLAVLEAVAREKFVPAERASLAYIDLPVPLSNGRSLNAPLITARLIVEAGIRAGDKVLLVGAATGYATALLAKLGATVVALEEDQALLTQAKANLAGVAGVSLVSGPLAAGWRKEAPYDAIVIDGAVEHVPDALAAQLSDVGRLVTGLVDSGVTRLAFGRKAGAGVGLVPFVEMETVPLPGFSKPKSFSF